MQGSASYSFVLFINSTSPHTLGIWAAYIQEVMLREFLSKESGDKKVSFKIINDPYPIGNQAESRLSSIQGFLLGFGMGIIYIIVAPSLVRNVVEEREKNLKNQMIVSGVKLPAYWIGHYAKDVFFGLILAFWVIILIELFDLKVPDAWVLLLLGTLAIPPFLYSFAFMFDKADTSSGLITFYMFVIAFLGAIAVWVLQLIDVTRFLADPLKWSLTFICPQFGIVNGILLIAFKQFFGFLQPADGECGVACDLSEPDSFDERIALIHLRMLIIDIIFWWAFVAFIDSSLWKYFISTPTS